GYRLMTNSGYMTIVRHIETQSQDWVSAIVGQEKLYRGHSDNNPQNRLSASSNDSLGYFGTGNNAPSDQRRTFILSNGETIWDFAGNVNNYIDLTGNSTTISGDACTGGTG